MFKYVLLMIFITNPAWSFNLDDALDKLNNNHKEKKYLSIDNIVSDLSDKAHDEVSNIKDKIAQFENKLSGEVNKIKDKVENTISDLDNKIKELDHLKSKLIFWAKIIASFLIALLLLLFFFIFRLFRRCNNIINIINNITNYDDIVTRIKKLEETK
jgi:nitrate/nitrite-specific signal transduction histidine kinase